jgi:D-glycero-alpha-D-manno-heptose-7-phosphate kinase|tara:strand:+ start:314 stop:1306 length:993 start_codon:yes stop_codon:yes gene_type:complete
MIITRTPFRISLAGGGTDFKNFYKNKDGKVLSFSIDKYIYVMAKRQLGIVDHKYKISWSRVEFCNKIKEIQHPIVRETLKYFKIDYPIEISTYADVPSNTGLGSSSAFAVGLVNAICSLQNKKLSKNEIAKIASKIEVDTLKRPMGRQDHYACCFGGINKITFKKSKILVKPLFKDKKFLKVIKNNFLLFYTDIRRDSSKILKEQFHINNNQEKTLCKMRDQVDQLINLVKNNKNTSEIGNILNTGWSLKKSISSKISNSKIEKYYKIAKKNGSTGGKLLGAGGGGFLLIYAPDNKKQKILKSLRGLFRLEFNLDFEGTQITHHNKSIKK